MTNSNSIMQRLLKELSREPKEYPYPEGWFTINQIREELSMAHTRNASSRALDLHRRGLLERQPHQYKSGTGQCHMAYVYRPVPPYKSIKQAADQMFNHRSDKVPKGWVRLVDYAVENNLSDVAVRGRVARAGLKPKYWKTPRGIIGLHLNAFYKKAELDRLYKA
jgi:predicted transcriptional regulator